MSNIPKDKRKESKFETCELATEIYNDVLNICLRMPNRYTYLILQNILNLASEVADYTTEGNAINFNFSKHPFGDITLRRTYFQKAKASQEALINKMRFFIDRPEALRHKIGDKEVGVTEYELDRLSDKMERELKNINGVIKADEERVDERKKGIIKLSSSTNSQGTRKYKK